MIVGLLLGWALLWAARLVGVAGRRVVLAGMDMVGVSGRFDATRRDARRIIEGRVIGTRARCRQCWIRRAEHADHVIPAAWGGPGATWNLRPLCARCNMRRGASLSGPELVWLLVPGPRDWPAYLFAVLWWAAASLGWT